MELERERQLRKQELLQRREMRQLELLEVEKDINIMEFEDRGYTDPGWAFLLRAGFARETADTYLAIRNQGVRFVCLNPYDWWLEAGGNQRVTIYSWETHDRKPRNIRVIDALKEMLEKAKAVRPSVFGKDGLLLMRLVSMYDADPPEAPPCG